MFKFLGKFFKKIGEIFVSAAKGAEKVWDSLEPQLQNVIKEASGFVALLNDNIDKTPDEMYQLIEALFPHYDKAEIESIINKVGTSLNMVADGVQPNILDTLANVMSFLKSHTGGEWAKLSEDIAGTIALFRSPNGTLWNKIGITLWWAYQTFIKKD